MIRAVIANNSGLTGSLALPPFVIDNTCVQVRIDGGVILDNEIGNEEELIAERALQRRFSIQ